MRIKYIFVAFCFTLLCLTTSCNTSFSNGKLSEVNFSKELKINIEYKFEVVDALISYHNGCLNFKYCDNCGTISGTEVTINTDEYKILSDEIEFKGNPNELNENFLPLIVYKLLSDNNGIVKTQMYDEKKECYYFEDSVLSEFLRFEIYENDGRLSYALIIT